MRLIFLGMWMLSGCARVNQPAQEHYRQQHGRHGIVVVRGERPVPKLPEALEAASVQRGEELYRRNCQVCHGATGRGATAKVDGKMQKVPDLRKTVREVENFSFYLTISRWQGSMPGWQRPYTEAEREDIAAYLKSFR